jgi:hypothetical protein
VWVDIGPKELILELLYLKYAQIFDRIYFGCGGFGGCGGIYGKSSCL